MMSQFSSTRLVRFTFVPFVLATMFSVDGRAVRAQHLDYQISENLYENSPSRVYESVQARRDLQLPGDISFFAGIDGSKQPQDFGANANLGTRLRANYAAPLFAPYGIGMQIGTAVAFSGNAVQVFELLGESKDRFQNFTTIGIFQRTGHPFSWGLVYDYLSQESFDKFILSQWRLGINLRVNACTEIGAVLNFSERADRGRFNDGIEVELRPVEQLKFYVRREWQTHIVTNIWIGIADRHSEENVVTGTLPPKDNQLLIGAEIFAPLNDFVAIYGSTNLVMPADTGAVDAFLGLELSPRSIYHSRGLRNHFRSFLPVASNPTFTTDLNRR